MSQKYELSEIPSQNCNSETNLTMGQKGRSGCFISSVVGVVLAFLVIVLVVAVGIIVHFTAEKNDLTCNCASTSGSKPETSAVVQQCVDMAMKGNQEICNSCSSSTGGTTSQVVTTQAPTTQPSAVIRDVRLPTSLNPVHYDVEIQPYMSASDPKDFTFKGYVRLLLECKHATNNVTLHVNVLKVTESSIRFYGAEPVASDPTYSGWEDDKDRQFFIIHLSKNMEVGKHYVVEMNFTSPLKDDLAGLYYSSYKRNNRTIYLATTQFQPTDARKTFPCMDEPALKATFNITLIRPSTLMSISNMPIADSSRTWREDNIEYTADVYMQSPKMSTYLLAFIICDFHYTEAISSNNIKYRALARPEAKASTMYALEAGVDVLTYFEQYFEIPFPLPKQDMIAIPDFAAGAMENWGLITYRETAMLYEEGVSSESNKDRVAVVVSHELAHQWFGDLVTPSWWGDLWLNEGFASFVEFMGVDRIHPEWNKFDTFVLDNFNVFDFDALTSSHPIYVPVYNPDEINEIFDRISYGKGAAVIRMMRHFLGYETFRKGVVAYLRKKAYDSAFHDDLWAALTEQARLDGKDIDVKAIMDTWTLQMNFPVVLVTRDFNAVNQLHVEQERYLTDRTAEDPGTYQSPFGYRWTIPLTFTSSQELDFNKTSEDVKWLNKEEMRKSFQFEADQLPPATNKDGWILANIDQNGFYRVNYQNGNWEALTKQLKFNHQVIPIKNRAQLINDAWSLSRSGDLDLEIALKLTEYLRNEVDYVPWSTASSELGTVRNMLSLTATYGPFKKFLAATTSNAYTQLGLDNTGSSHHTIFARSIVANYACSTGNTNCTNAASSQFRDWMNDPQNNRIDPNLKSTIYCNAISAGGWDEWKFALEKYLETSVASEKSKLLSALACSSQPWILNHYLSIVVDENSVIRKQDALSVIIYISRNSIGRPLAWNLFKGKYDFLRERFGNSFFAWTNLIGEITKSFNTEFDLEEIRTLMERKKDALGTGKRAFEQAIEKTKSNIKWMNTNLPVISKWLADQGFN